MCRRRRDKPVHSICAGDCGSLWHEEDYGIHGFGNSLKLSKDIGKAWGYGVLNAKINLEFDHNI